MIIETKISTLDFILFFCILFNFLISLAIPIVCLNQFRLFRYLSTFNLEIEEKSSTTNKTE